MGKARGEHGRRLHKEEMGIQTCHLCAVSVYGTLTWGSSIPHFISSGCPEILPEAAGKNRSQTGAAIGFVDGMVTYERRKYRRRRAGDKARGRLDAEAKKHRREKAGKRGYRIRTKPVYNMRTAAEEEGGGERAELSYNMKKRTDGVTI